MAVPVEHDEHQTAGISAEDQREIRQEIERVGLENRIDVHDDLFHVDPAKNGAVFPLLVNLIGLIVLAAGVFFLSQVFAVNEEQIRSTGRNVVTTESRLIEEIRRESEEQLAAKDEEIAEIQAQLQAISEERSALAADIQERIQRREDQLRREFEAELEAERQRLLNLNLSDEDIESRLAEFSRAKEREYEQRLAQFRRETEVEQQRLEAELNTLETQFARTLESANAERRALQEENRNRLAELQSTFAAELAQGRAELSAAEAELARLTEEQERTELVRSQLRGLYRQVEAAIVGDDMAAARGRLSDIRTLLNEENVLRIPAIREERSIDLFVVDALERLLRFEERFGNPETLQRLSDAALIQEVTDRVAEADAAARAGDVERAGALYRSALEIVPATAEAFAFLSGRAESVNAEEAARRNTAAAAILAQARSEREAENWTEAVQRYSEILRTFPGSRFRAEAVEGIRQVTERLVSESGDTITELNDRLAELESDRRVLTEELSATEAERAAARERAQEVTTALERSREANARLTSELETQAELAAEVARVRERAAEIEEQRERLEAELARTENELTDALAQRAGAQGEAAQARAVVAELNDELAVVRARVAEAERALEEEQAEASRGSTAANGRDVDPETMAELARLREVAAGIADAQAAYDRYLSEAAGVGDSTVETLEAKVALERFLNHATMQRFFPRLDEEVGRLEDAYVTSGRENAYLDIADLLLDVGSAGGATERRRIVDSARANFAGSSQTAGAGSELLTRVEELVEALD